METLIGYSGAFAFRAALPDSVQFSDPSAVKEAQRAFIYAMADSPLVGADLGKRIRYFNYSKKYETELEEVERVPKFRQDASTNVAFTCHEGNRFFTWVEWSQYSGIEFASSGKFTDMTPDYLHDLGPGWGTREELDSFFELYESKGPIPVAETIEAFSEATGLSIPEATLAVTNWGAIHLKGLKANVLKWATDVFRCQSLKEHQFFSEVVTSGPIADLWDVDKLTKRLVTTWLKGTKKLPLIEPELVDLYKKQNKWGSTYILREIADPSISAELTKDKKLKWNDTAFELDGDGFSGSSGYIGAVDFALQNARVGTDIHKGIAETLRKLRERISNEDHLYEIGSFWEREKPEVVALVAMVKGTPKGAKKNDAVAGTDGVYRINGSWSVDFYANWKQIQAKNTR